MSDGAVPVPPNEDRSDDVPPWRLEECQVLATVLGPHETQADLELAVALLKAAPQGTA